MSTRAALDEALDYLAAGRLPDAAGRRLVVQAGALSPPSSAYRANLSTLFQVKID